MIKKSLITALLLLLAYHFIQPRLSRDYYWVPGQQRANYIRAQQYVNDTADHAGVVVGSSMANELSQEILGPGLVKLTFPAGGSFSGLDIIRRSGKKPEVLLIETNTLLRDVDDVLTENAAGPWRRKLREVSPVFKDEGRPSNYEVGFLNTWVTRICHGFTRVMNGGKKPAPGPPKPIDPSVREDVLRSTREQLSKPVSKADLAARIRKLGEMVDAFTREGTRCYFFEMPFDPSLEPLKVPATVRAAMEARFPADKYRWIGIDRSRDYETSDGIHLVPADAEEVSRILVRGAAGS